MKMNWYDTKCSIFGLRFFDMEMNITRQSNYRFIFEAIFIWTPLLFFSLNYFIRVCCLCLCIYTRQRKGEKVRQKSRRKKNQNNSSLNYDTFVYVLTVAHIYVVWVRVPVFRFCALHSLIKRYGCMRVSLPLQQCNSNMLIPETCVNVVVLRLIKQWRNGYATNEKQYTWTAAKEEPKRTKIDWEGQ